MEHAPARALIAAGAAVGGGLPWHWHGPEELRLVLVHVGRIADEGAAVESLAAAARALEPFSLVADRLALGPDAAAVRRLDARFAPSRPLGELVRRLVARFVSPARRGSGEPEPALALARLAAPQPCAAGPWPLDPPIAIAVSELELRHSLVQRGGTSEVTIARAPLGAGR